MKKIILVLIVLSLFACKSISTTTPSENQETRYHSNPYWQQHVDYKMEIDMNVDNYQFHGKQKLIYTNNSPDDLKTVYYHLYFNAFQPNSAMDIRLQNIEDPDNRMVTKDKKSRIATLKENEIGYQKINSLKQNGKSVKYKVYGTILKVTLNTPIKSGAKATFDMDFNGQVPVQIRRSGRNNAEGVALSMTQWYPKMAEYDFEGWHADEYIAREFYGVWGDFDVKITINKDYILGGTGYLQNANQIGYGYEKKGEKVKRPKTNKLTWHFIAPNVHDFTWAADKEYIHDTYQGPNDVTLHFLYKNNVDSKSNWKKLQKETAQTMAFYNKTVGNYPYKQYSVIQGGDGGMEYGMCTLITGNRKMESLIGVMRHEMAHSWFQFALASNETEHPWMDEGFTSYLNTLADIELDNKTEFPFDRVYKTNAFLTNSDKNEPLSIPGDRYQTNMAYGINSYYKGQIYLSQMEYLIGKDNVLKTLKRYFKEFKMKHPNPTDISRTAEKVSGLQLGWYLNEWIETTHKIDYAIKNVSEHKVNIERVGEMPMPLDVRVTFTDDSTQDYLIPLRMMLGHKTTNAIVLEDWFWTKPTYSFTTEKTIKKVEIDPTQQLADANMKDNVFKL